MVLTQPICWGPGSFLPFKPGCLTAPVKTISVAFHAVNHVFADKSPFSFGSMILILLGLLFCSLQEFRFLYLQNFPCWSPECLLFCPLQHSSSVSCSFDDKQSPFANVSHSSTSPSAAQLDASRGQRARRTATSSWPGFTSQHCLSFTGGYWENCVTSLSLGLGISKIVIIIRTPN